MTEPLSTYVRSALARPVMSQARQLADAIVVERGDAVAAILFYGSCLRDETAEGVLDFYVLVDQYRDWHGAGVDASINRILPPNVIFIQHGGVAAKVAIISTKAFRRRMRRGSFDTTLWARFCQPAALLYARDEQAHQAAVAGIVTACATAWAWACALSTEADSVPERWTTLFRHTYRAELRVEKGGDRAASIYAKATPHFEQVATLVPAGKTPVAGSVRLAWGWRVVAGKPLNALRILKGAFTFAGGVDYMVWKIERHSGQKFELSGFQRRHPLIAAPLILWRLVRGGLVR